MIGLPRDALIALRTVLFRQAGPNAATYLYEAGYAGGQALHDAFIRWSRARKLPVPDTMAAPDFERHVTAFFSELGMGAIRIGTLDDAAVTIDSSNWAESEPGSGMQFPGCYLSAGLMTDFFSRVGGAPVSALEVECRSAGADRCRFLIGSAETIQQVYDGIAQGTSYEAALLAG